MNSKEILIRKKRNLRNTSFRTLLSLLVCCVLFSCTKEDSVLIEQKEEPFSTEISLRINNQTVSTNAFATYCKSGDNEFLAVSNKEVLLDTTLLFNDFIENDFMFFTRSIDGSAPFSYGGAAFGEVFTGVPGLQVIFTDAEINIESNDGVLVTGTMDGDFAVFDPGPGTFTLLPFSVYFSAVIIPKPELCN